MVMRQAIELLRCHLCTTERAKLLAVTLVVVTLNIVFSLESKLEVGLFLVKANASAHLRP